MAQILPFRKPHEKWDWGNQKKRNFYLAVPVLVCFISVLTIYNINYGNMPFANDAKGSASISASQKFTLCGWNSQRNCIVDGDTIKVAGKKIRVEDIDTPEIHDYKCQSEFERGQRAKARLLELVNAGPFEIVSNGGDDMDRYGRKLRHLKRNGRSLGAILVSEGLARPYAGGRRSWC